MRVRMCVCKEAITAHLLWDYHRRVCTPEYEYILLLCTSYMIVCQREKIEIIAHDHEDDKEFLQIHKSQGK